MIEVIESKLLVVWGLCKLHALFDVALKDRHQVINALLLNGAQLAQVTHLLNTSSTQLDLHSVYCTNQSKLWTPETYITSMKCYL